MPCYEYECINPNKGCERCQEGFELQQRITEDAIEFCPFCSTSVKKIISPSSFALTGDGWTRRGV